MHFFTEFFCILTSNEKNLDVHFFSANINIMEGKSSTENAQKRQFFNADLAIDNVQLLSAKASVRFGH